MTASAWSSGSASAIASHVSAATTASWCAPSTIGDVGEARAPSRRPRSSESTGAALGRVPGALGALAHRVPVVVGSVWSSSRPARRRPPIGRVAAAPAGATRARPDGSVPRRRPRGDRRRIGAAAVSTSVFDQSPIAGAVQRHIEPGQRLLVPGRQFGVDPRHRGVVESAHRIEGRRFAAAGPAAPRRRGPHPARPEPAPVRRAAACTHDASSGLERPQVSCAAAGRRPASGARRCRRYRRRAAGRADRGRDPAMSGRSAYVTPRRRWRLGPETGPGGTRSGGGAPRRRAPVRVSA